MNFGILTQYLGKWFINPLENFFILWHILILPHFTPDQGQKMIFWWFEQCGISLDMLERVKWPVLWNLSLIFIIMRIHEKKIGTLSTEIGPAETKIFKFGPKKHISVQVLKMLQMTWAFELKPYTINNEDWWWKMGCLNTKNLWIAHMLLFFRCVFCSEVFWYYDTPIFLTDPRYL